MLTAFGRTEAKSAAGHWTPLNNQPTFQAGHPLLLTDGTVICQEVSTGNWYRLSPDKRGSYVNGTWDQIGSLPAGYGPLYYASAVLADGRVVIAGGEYNFGASADTALGAIYDPKTNVWSNLEPPPGFNGIGDAPSVVLPDKRWMLANAFGADSAVLDPATLAWTSLGANGKTDSNNEEGFYLLPNGSVLTVVVGSTPASETYLPALDEWVNAGSTIVPLSDYSSFEIGPAVLRPEGTLFYTGVCAAVNGLCVSPAHTAIYKPGRKPGTPGTWTPGPDFPTGLDISDGPAAILPNGNVLLMAGPGIYQSGAVFFEFDGKNLNQVESTPNAPHEPSFAGSMLVLPTGQILLTDFSSDVEIYTPQGAHHADWAPAIYEAPFIVNPGSSYKISGIQFNGLSQGASYGDDAQMNTNYPLLRFTSLATGNVSYWRTHDHSTMGVATGNQRVYTYFDVPDTCELSLGLISVVANGIPSLPRIVLVNSAGHK
jgi:hypothetical protein